MNEREAVLEETWLFFKKFLGHWCEESLEVGLWSPIAFCDFPHTIGLLGAVLACWFLLIWVTLLGQFTQAGHFKQSGYLCLNLPRKKYCLCWGSGCATQNLTPVSWKLQRQRASLTFKWREEEAMKTQQGHQNLQRWPWPCSESFLPWIRGPFTQSYMDTLSRFLITALPTVSSFMKAPCSYTLD